VICKIRGAQRERERDGVPDQVLVDLTTLGNVFLPPERVAPLVARASTMA
jgi:hypothetical protein